MGLANKVVVIQRPQHARDAAVIGRAVAGAVEGAVGDQAARLRVGASGDDAEARRGGQADAQSGGRGKVEVGVQSAHARALVGGSELPHPGCARARLREARQHALASAGGGELHKVGDAGNVKAKHAAAAAALREGPGRQLPVVADLSSSGV